MHCIVDINALHVDNLDVLVDLHYSTQEQDDQCVEAQQSAHSQLAVSLQKARGRLNRTLIEL